TLSFLGCIFPVFTVFKPSPLLVAGIVDELSENDSPSCCERTLCPPAVKSRWISCWRFPLAFGRLRVDEVERQSDLDQLSWRFDGISHRGRLLFDSKEFRS